MTDLTDWERRNPELAEQRFEAYSRTLSGRQARLTRAIADLGFAIAAPLVPIFKRIRRR